jgi:hypothetical protein
VTITATGGWLHQSITFTIVEPSDWTMERQTGTIFAARATPTDCGWLGIMFVHPNDELYRSRRGNGFAFVATGSYSISVLYGNSCPTALGEVVSIVRHSR